MFVLKALFLHVKHSLLDDPVHVAQVLKHEIVTQIPTLLKAYPELQTQVLFGNKAEFGLQLEHDVDNEFVQFSQVLWH
jgi:hypothetical protein